MRLLLLVHTSPGNLKSRSALALARAAVADGIHVSMFFHADGIYHTLPVTAVDPGVQALFDGYQQLAEKFSVNGVLQLLVCRASHSRRTVQSLAPPWQESGLIELADLLRQADRVISFV